jgi:outer membrane protein OmpA-like peptidoglycan-associated protein
MRPTRPPRFLTSVVLPAVITLALIAGPLPLRAQAVLSEFEGSTPLGTYESSYDRLAYATSLAKDAPVEAVEGRLISRAFEKPAGRSNLEVFRSYQNELERGGFAIHLATQLDAPTSFRLKQIYDPPHTPSFRERNYARPDGQGRMGRLDLSFIVGSADHYLIASRVAGGEERWVAVLLSGSRPTYLIEELTLDAMESGTVTLNLEAMRSEIDSAGKIAIYDIHFATGSAEIEPESAAALAVIASYLGETSGGFYIVGHTDDTGSLDSNMTLSEARAAAVKQVLVEEHGVDPARLETRGVGPLAPVTTNANESGRSLNRRVEIVQRLP